MKYLRTDKEVVFDGILNVEGNFFKDKIFFKFEKSHFLWKMKFWSLN